MLQSHAVDGISSSHFAGAGLSGNNNFGKRQIVLRQIKEERAAVARHIQRKRLPCMTKVRDGNFDRSSGDIFYTKFAIFVSGSPTFVVFQHNGGVFNGMFSLGIQHLSGKGKLSKCRMQNT